MKKENEILWGAFDEIVSIFPGVEEFRRDYDKVKNGCVGCKRAALSHKLLVAIVKLHKAYANEIPEELVEKLGKPYQRLLHPEITKMDKLRNNGGVRETCLDCCRKHIGQAIILFQESLLHEYRRHFWLAVGHLAEAESETLSKYRELALTIRSTRLGMMNDKNYEPDLLEFFDKIEVLEEEENKGK